MPNAHLEDFQLIEMWPRSLMKVRDGKRKLAIKPLALELQRPGVYVLYRGQEPHYIGKANKLWSRLHDHSNKATDSYFAHWDHFSAFVMLHDAEDIRQKLVEIEAVLIAAIPLAKNNAHPKYKKIRIPKALLRGL